MSFDFFNKNKIRSLEESLILKDKEIESLTSKNDLLRNELSDLKIELATNNGKLSEIERIHNKYQVELEKEFDKRLESALSENNAKYEEIIQGIKKELSDSEDKNIKLQLDFKDLKRLYDGSQITIKNLEQKISLKNTDDNIFVKLEKQSKRTKPYASTAKTFDDSYYYAEPFIYVKNRTKRLSVDFDLYDKIDELANKEYPIGHIAKELNILPGTVSTIIERMNNENFRDMYSKSKKYWENIPSHINKDYTVKSSDGLLTLNYHTEKNKWVGKIIDTGFSKTFGRFDTFMEAIEERTRILNQYENEGYYQRLKMSKHYNHTKPLPHEKRVSKWSEGLKWVKGKLHFYNIDTNINRLIINDIQSLRANGYSLDNIYAEFSTRYPNTNATCVRTIFENLDQPDFQEFYKKGAI